MKYCNIVFVHDYEDATVNRLLHEFNSIDYDNPIKESIDYLSQWDYGKESEYDLMDNPPWGTSDYTEQIEEYVLSYNVGLGYMALCRIVYTE